MNKFGEMYKHIMGLIMIVFLFGMPVSYIFTPDREFSESENRVLNVRPKLSASSIASGKFTSNYEKYISDQIIERDFWIGVKAASERLIGKKDNNGVYLGEDGYLLQMFSKPDPEIMNKNIECINEFSKANPDVNKYFMLVPNSVKVLEDKLPPYASPEDQLVYMDKVREGLDNGVNFIDVYDTLAALKHEYIYYKTDHHWTTKGAYYAYRRLGEELGFTPNDEAFFDIKKVTEDFYGTLYSKGGFRNTTPDSIELYSPKQEENINVWYYDLEKSSDSIYKMNNLNVKDKYTVFLDGNHPLIRIETPNTNSRKLLIAKDSYANSLVPFLTSHYSEIYMVDLRFYYEDIYDFIASNEIDDVLLLYNANTFFEDDSISRIAWQ